MVHQDDGNRLARGLHRSEASQATTADDSATIR